MNSNRISLRAWGEWACFTRPEMKVERVSYRVMTPSAARGLLEAIFWEPQMYYLISEIRILKRGRWTAFRRNEVTARISINNAKRWMSEPQSFTPIAAGGGAADGTQRNMLALGDVEYIITAEVQASELGKRAGQTTRKYVEEITRRARTGKCFHRPCFGMREFAADFEFEADPEAAFTRRREELTRELKGDWEIWNENLGLMLYDVFDYEERAAGFRWLSDGEIAAQIGLDETSVNKHQKAKKRTLMLEEGKRVAPVPAFFQAEIKDSVLACHPSHIELIRRTPASERS